MATYVVLFKYTRQGMDRIKDSPSRIDAARQAFRDAGAEMKAWYLTMGRYDGMVLAEAPDDETMARLALTIGALGNISTETLRAFSEDEFRTLIGAIS
jgi:uncharacterized protein with GYD domain